ncbi:HNH endonuclease [Paractinoplanes hotanensis]|uniref:HNH endonuclease n=1 Tax=Paractinoplanes hotanensis TaxID=2906497 RepID=A0ABT0XXF3_9ACTN|nr:HNH endonuclease [Actinoplanes hotanensis]MCM4078305.1 HNH endonuclease [Actinoplanes hotanensis]
MDPRSLFSGPAWRVDRFGSEELREWFAEHGRITLAKWRAMTSTDRQHMTPLVGQKPDSLPDVTQRAPESMSISMPDGTAMDIELRPDDPGETVELTMIEPIHRRVFERCPICGDPATSEEHVPPERIGGKKLTLTCEPCNNRLGSYVEPDLIDWVEGAISRPLLRSDAVQGPRKEKRLLVRNTPSGEFVLVVDGRAHRDLGTMLASGELDLDAVLPNWDRCKIALLKHAYLAACLTYGVIEGEVADEIRRDLVAARDAKSRQDVPMSRLAMGLTVCRTYEPTTDEPAIRAVLHEPSGDVEGVLLVGRIFVSWSSAVSAEAPEVGRRQLGRTLEVGAPAQGTVTSVRP